MYQAFVVGLKALHDLLNKRLEQQVKNRAVKAMSNLVLCDISAMYIMHRSNKPTTVVQHTITRLIFSLRVVDHTRYVYVSGTVGGMHGGPSVTGL